VTYSIVRFYESGSKSTKVLKSGVSLKEAKAHCNDPETAWNTAVTRSAKAHTAMHGAWFDGWRKE